MPEPGLESRVHNVLVEVVNEYGVGVTASAAETGDALLSQLDSFGRVQFLLEMEEQLHVRMDDGVLDEMSTFDRLVSHVGGLLNATPPAS